MSSSSVLILTSRPHKDNPINLSTYLVSVKVLVALQDFLGGLAGLDNIVVIVALPFLH